MPPQQNNQAPSITIIYNYSDPYSKTWWWYEDYQGIILSPQNMANANRRNPSYTSYQQAYSPNPQSTRPTQNNRWFANDITDEVPSYRLANGTLIALHIARARGLVPQNSMPNYYDALQWSNTYYDADRQLIEQELMNFFFDVGYGKMAYPSMADQYYDQNYARGNDGYQIFANNQYNRPTPQYIQANQYANQYTKQQADPYASYRASYKRRVEKQLELADQEQQAKQPTWTTQNWIKITASQPLQTVPLVPVKTAQAWWLDVNAYGFLPNWYKGRTNFQTNRWANVDFPILRLDLGEQKYIQEINKWFYYIQ